MCILSRIHSTPGDRIGPSMTEWILGISAFYHDSAACLLHNGVVVAAAQEERFSRKKYDPDFPIEASRFCLETAAIGVEDLSSVAFYDNPALKFDRILKTYLSFAPRGGRSFADTIPGWIRRRMIIPGILRDRLGYTGAVYYSEHHLSHAASAFFLSPFETAAILTVDGVGEWATTSWGIGSQNRIQLEQEIQFPNSLGLLYSAFTQYTGFKVNSDEYKVMGLAPYGEPRYKDLIYEHLLDVQPDGSYCLKLSHFDFCTGFSMTNGKFHDLFGGAPRRKDGPITARDMDLARSIQEVTEETMLKMAAHIADRSAQQNLCLAGGTALNCVCNGKILRSGLFDDIWIQPAAGDAGGALGAALAVHHIHLGADRNVTGSAFDCALGSGYTDDEIVSFLEQKDVSYEVVPDVAAAGATLLAEGNVLGWFQGRMEFGPRALGNRSILADARGTDTQSVINQKIKFRESFRPFAPAILEDEAAEYFEIDRPSPYMLLVADVVKEKLLELDAPERLSGLDKLKAKRSVIPAVTHVDNSARIQTVNKAVNSRFYDLLYTFWKSTGSPVIVNTSFNVRDEPIVRTPEEAYLCYVKTGMDALLIGSCLLQKEPRT